MTPERFKRLRAALERRQPDLTVVMEGVNKGHNFSAVLRTCDAVGVFEAHAVGVPGELRASPTYSVGTGKWVAVRSHDRLEEAVAPLRDADFQLLAAHLRRDAVDYREADYTRPTALLLGEEKDGLSATAVAAADRLVAIPMEGLGRSLNVSVAAALLLFEARRQRRRAGMYGESRLEPRRFRETLFEWAHPVLAAHCRRHGFAYPALDDDGELAEPLPR